MPSQHIYPDARTPAVLVHYYRIAETTIDDFFFFSHTNSKKCVTSRRSLRKYILNMIIQPFGMHRCSESVCLSFVESVFWSSFCNLLVTLPI